MIRSRRSAPAPWVELGSAPSPAAVLAGGLLVSIPTVALFLATQRFFTQGLSLGQV